MITASNTWKWIGIGYLTLLVGWAQAQGFRATADRTEVPMDEVVRITYTFENVEANDFNPPDFNPFEAYGPSQSRNMSWINGKSSQTLSYTYTLKPTKEGDFVIPPAHAKVDGKIQKSESISLKVVAAGTPPPANPDPDPGNQNDQSLDRQLRDNLFMRVIPDKTTVYKGEQVTLTYKLYYAVDLDDLSVVKMPSFDGFLSYDIELTEAERARKVEAWNGRNYHTQVIDKVALFPSHDGQYTIEPMELQSIVLVRTNDPGFFFPRAERYRYEFKSSAQKIDVKPLPPGAPASFTGAVGQYGFTAEYDKTETQAGDPITLRLEVKGKGNIKLIEVPKPDFPQSFEIYDPKINESVSKRSSTINGSKRFEYLIIPGGGGTFELPDLSFSWFDPAVEKYRTVTEEGPEITVEGEALNPQSYPGTGFNKEEVELLGEDIRFIHTGAIAERSSGCCSCFLRSPLFLVLTVLPVFLGLFLPLVNARRRRLHADTARMRSRKARKLAARRLAEARKLATQSDDKAFYNEIVKVLRQYVGDKFDTTPAAVTGESIRLSCAERGVSETLTEETARLLETCEMAVYAPMAVNESKSGIADRAAHLIEQLENELPS